MQADREVVLRLGVAARGRGAGGVAGLGRARDAVEDGPVDLGRVQPVAHVVAGVDQDHLAGQRLRLAAAFACGARADGRRRRRSLPRPPSHRPRPVRRARGRRGRGGGWRRRGQASWRPRAALPRTIPAPPCRPDTRPRRRGEHDDGQRDTAIAGCGCVRPPLVIEGSDAYPVPGTKYSRRFDGGGRRWQHPGSGLAITSDSGGGGRARRAAARARARGSAAASSRRLPFGTWVRFDVGAVGSVDSQGIFRFRSDTKVRLRVVDGFCRGDRFRVFDRGRPLFQTSDVAIDQTCLEQPFATTGPEAWHDHTLQPRPEKARAGPPPHQHQLDPKPVRWQQRVDRDPAHRLISGSGTP